VQFLYSQLVADDGCVRDTTPEQLSELKTPFLEGGTITAGSSSPLTDGATAVLVCTEEFAARHDIEPLARVKSFAVSGCAPGIMGIGPVEASRKALSRAGGKNWFILAVDNAFGKTIQADLTKTVESTGGRIVTTVITSLNIKGNGGRTRDRTLDLSRVKVHD